MSSGTVIVGTGQAGFQTAASLRNAGYLEPITMIGDEPHIPHQRPPLSKGFLLGKQSAESIALRPEKFYRDHRIELLTGRRVTAIEPSARRVVVDGRAGSGGGTFAYDKLVLSVGARNRKLAVAGAELDGVLYLRSLGEAVEVKERLAGAHEVVVIGGGFVGLELASVASAMGKSVTVLEMLPRLMSRVVAPVISDFYRGLHGGHGVRVQCDASVERIVGANGKALGVMLSDGTTVPADLVLIGAGVIPNVELAAEAGLTITNGIAVNSYLQTSNDDIYAIGDCAEHPCVFVGGRIRLESVQNASDQAQCVAATIAGARKQYEELPWFWTDQFDIKLQMAGISLGHDQIVTRGSAESRKLSVFYFREGRLVAVDSINRPLDHMIGRKLIAAGITLTPEQACDESVDLRRLMKAPEASAI
ncbi:MAG TPA: FAD-dependent oxidoreductase [Candidatus Acidoferrum sp.]|jgi:3-phenylpropionate/trans-cinnamate dioxygenase ferredoxin reductase subunit